MVTALTFSELLRENQQGGVKITQLPPTQIRVKVTTNLICWITGIYSKMNL